MATLLRRAPVTAVDTRFLVALGDRCPDLEPVRLVMRLHVGNSRARAATWRIVAELIDGRRRLVCYGTSPAEARATAREAARARELPAHTLALRMQRWVGTPTAGSWLEEC